MAAATKRKRIDLGAWAFVAPALLWTAAFFVAPFIVMAVVSLWERVGTDLVASWTFANYLKFFERGALLPGDGEFAGGHGYRDRDLHFACLSVCLDHCRKGAGPVAAAGAGVCHPAVLDVLCGALLFLASGACQQRDYQPGTARHRSCRRATRSGQQPYGDGDRLLSISSSCF